MILLLKKFFTKGSFLIDTHGVTKTGALQNKNDSKQGSRKNNEYKIKLFAGIFTKEGIQFS